MSREALHCSIDTLCSHLKTYDIKVSSILHEQDTCTASVKELEGALVVVELMNKEMEMAQEKVHYDVKRGSVA